MSAVCMLAGVSFFYFLSSVVTRTVSVFVIDVLISFYLFMFISIDCDTILVAIGV
ncbi:hypothetical protein PAENIP36_73210 [Paenibacillus sp. P36]